MSALGGLLAAGALERRPPDLAWVGADGMPARHELRNLWNERHWSARLHLAGPSRFSARLPGEMSALGGSIRLLVTNPAPGPEVLVLTLRGDRGEPVTARLGASRAWVPLHVPIARGTSSLELAVSEPGAPAEIDLHVQTWTSAVRRWRFGGTALLATLLLAVPLGWLSLRRGSRAAGAAVTVLLAMASLELSLRLLRRMAFSGLIASRPGSDLITVVSPDPRLLYTYRPDTPETNAYGYMDHPHELRKAPGVFRIAVIGDSVAAGFLLESVDESFGRCLERLLNEEGGPRYEVLLLARAGYSTRQELVVLEEDALPRRPDLVLWSYVLNDPAHPIYHNANGELGRFYHRPALDLGHQVARLAFLVREAVRGLSAPEDYHERLHAIYREDVERDIARIGEIARRGGVPVAFVLQPLVNVKDYDRYPLAGLHGSLAALATKAGLVPIDLLPVYRAAEWTKLGRPDDPYHPTAYGHQVEAEALLLELRRLGLVPSGANAEQAVERSEAEEPVRAPGRQ